MGTLSEVRMKRVIYPVILTCITAIVISVVVLSSVPPVSRDALTHHLVVPKLYLEHGGIYEIPSIKFSYYPMNIDLLYMVPLLWGNDIVPKYIHFLFALFTALLMYYYLKKRIGRLYGSLGALFFLSIPIIVRLSITVYVDLGLIFFSFASLIYMLEWGNQKFQFKFLFFSSLCCGLALGTKYNALILFALISLLIPVVYSRSAPASSAKVYTATKYSMFFILIALFFFSPWMIRNYLWKKNPVYPLYHQFFSSDKVEKKEEHGDGSGKIQSKKQIGSFAIRRIIYQEAWWQTASIPVRIFFQGEDNNPKFFDGKLNPFLLMLPVFAFWGYKDARCPTMALEKKIMLGFSALFLVFAFFAQDIRIRYISPIIPPLVVLSMYGLHNLIERAGEKRSLFQKSFYYIIAGSIICWMFWINLGYIIEQFRHVAPMAYLTGQVDRDQYIENYRPEYAVIKYANRNLASDAKILSVFLGNRYYYSDHQMIFSFSVFAETVKKSKSPEEILSALKQNGITHIMIGYDLFNDWANRNFSKQEKIHINFFFKQQVELLFSKNGYGLYRL
ncbi:MAG: phospholipid carrier-dependent glycosyltransferase [Desulfobacteraceae bacterium]|nr:MAG: phospholipid carrier-dependent glycosyltransferase [Desulfobacteraceae bacterium]